MGKYYDEPCDDCGSNKTIVDKNATPTGKCYCEKCWARRNGGFYPPRS